MADEIMPAIVDTVVEQPMDFTVYATNPADMVGAQKSLILWSARKIMAAKEDLKEAETNLEAARTHRWSTKGWERQVKKASRRMEFYRKIKLALENGYYIVPPFPIDLFAIRTTRSAPRWKVEDTNWRDRHEQKATPLEAGVGRYVSPDPVLRNLSHQRYDDNGKAITVHRFAADEWNEAEFPFKLAKAEIMAATRSAMALKVFDQMGALPTHRAPDPIICGQILYPEQSSYGPRRAVTFFVSWWLDTKTL